MEIYVVSEGYENDEYQTGWDFTAVGFHSTLEGARNQVRPHLEGTYEIEEATLDEPERTESLERWVDGVRYLCKKGLYKGLYERDPNQ